MILFVCVALVRVGFPWIFRPSEDIRLLVLLSTERRHCLTLDKRSKFRLSVYPTITAPRHYRSSPNSEWTHLLLIRWCVRIFSFPSIFKVVTFFWVLFKFMAWPIVMNFETNLLGTKGGQRVCQDFHFPPVQRWRPCCRSLRSYGLRARSLRYLNDSNRTN